MSEIISPKEKIIKILSENNIPISGQNIAEIIGISRNAVWKNIKSLEDEGFIIGSDRSKGYILEKIPSKLSSPALRTFLPEEFSSAKILTPIEIPSTNTDAETHLSSNENDILIATHSQTMGKGRYGRSFLTTKGGLYFSFGTKNETFLKNDNFDLITIISAIAVNYSILELYNLKTTIKWVNDIKISGKKCGGILTSSKWNMESNSPEYVVCGIGINVKIPDEGFPDEIKDRATALFEDIPENLNYNELAGKIISIFFKIFKKDRAEIIENYNRICDSRGKTVAFVEKGQKVQGIAKNVNDKGHLIIEFEKGVKELSSGEIYEICI